MISWFLFVKPKIEGNPVQQIVNLSFKKDQLIRESFSVHVNLNNVTLGFCDENKVNIIHVNKIVIEANQSSWYWVESPFQESDQNYLIIQNNINFEIKEVKANYSWDKFIKNQYNKLFIEFHNFETESIIFIIPVGKCKLLKSHRYSNWKVETIIDNFRPKFNIGIQSLNYDWEIKETINEIDWNSLLWVTISNKWHFNIK